MAMYYRHEEDRRYREANLERVRYKIPSDGGEVQIEAIGIDLGAGEAKSGAVALPAAAVAG